MIFTTIIIIYIYVYTLIDLVIKQNLLFQNLCLLIFFSLNIQSK